LNSLVLPCTEQDFYALAVFTEQIKEVGMIAFEAILLPNNHVQILQPLLPFPRPRRIIITVLDEEVDAQPEQMDLSPRGTASAERGAWLLNSTRIPNLHAGLIHMSDDFDAALPDSFWLGEEEGAEQSGSTV
jgi:hypothetical protein